MDKLTQWIALTVVACLAIVAAGWFLLVSPKRAEAADLRDQAVAQDATNETTRAQLTVLKAQAKDLPKKQADLARVAAKIPDNPGLPSLIRALTVASTSAGVEFVSVEPGQPTPVVAAAATAAATATPAPNGTTTTTAAAPSVGTLAAIPVAINVVGDYFEVEQFIAELEDLPRALRIENLTLSPGLPPTDTKSGASADDGRSLVSVISGSVYLASARPVATPVTAPVDAAASPAPVGSPLPGGPALPTPLPTTTAPAK